MFRPARARGVKSLNTPHVTQLCLTTYHLLVSHTHNGDDTLPRISRELHYAFCSANPMNYTDTRCEKYTEFFNRCRRGYV